jgi:hypothetical protein
LILLSGDNAEMGYTGGVICGYLGINNTVHSYLPIAIIVSINNGSPIPLEAYSILIDVDELR